MKNKTPKGQMTLVEFDKPTTDYDVLSAFESEEQWLSRKQLAERCFRKKTPSFVARIESLVADGHLERMTSTLPNRVDMFYYRRISPLDVPPF